MGPSVGWNSLLIELFWPKLCSNGSRKGWIRLWPAVLNWHVGAETDLFNFQCCEILTLSYTWGPKVTLSGGALVWENSRHLATLPLVSPENDVWKTSAEIPYRRRVTTHAELDSASDWLNQISHATWPIRSTTQFWVVTRHQYGISALVFQTSFGGETSGSVAKCRLLSQASGASPYRPFDYGNPTCRCGFSLRMQDGWEELKNKQTNNNKTQKFNLRYAKLSFSLSSKIYWADVLMLS